MKVSAIALLGFVATGVLAGGKPEEKCKKIQWQPESCKPWRRDLVDLEDRDAEEFDERDVEVEERDEELDTRGYPYPPPVCKKKCPKHKLKCTNYGWAKGYPKYKGSFSDTVDCKKGKDYTVSGSIGPCKKGYGTCLTITYDGGYWPKGHEKSYVGIYENKWDGPKEADDLNYSKYCWGNVCSIPVDKLPGYPKLCGDDLWVGFDASRCKSWGHSDHGYGYGKDKGKGKGWKDEIDYAKLHIECYGKKECKSYCCNI